MDTYEARCKMRDLGHEALDLLRNLAEPRMGENDPAKRLRIMEGEARSLLADAGYPGEGVWRALTASCRLADQGAGNDESIRPLVVNDLTVAIQTLDSLLATAEERDADFRIVG